MFGVQRHDVMYNDFVVVGPKSDPAGIKGMTDVDAALKKIAAAKAPFASRGDNSGTNKKELELWRAADENVTERSEEHTSEPQSLMRSSYGLFCFKKKYDIA